MIWYPYEQMKTMKAPYKIIDADGVYLYTEDQKLIDSVSSWWCMIHGYKHPELTQAIKEQADHFCHVMLGGLTHDPVQKLSQKLEEFLPGDLDYCFFSDSGSVAVEVSLKMALQYNTNQDRKRPMVSSILPVTSKAPENQSHRRAALLLIVARSAVPSLAFSLTWARRRERASAAFIQ